MPFAVRIIDKVAEMTDWNQSSFLDGYFVKWNSTTEKFEGGVPSGSGSSASSLIVSGLNTTSLTTSGLFGYVSSNNTLSLTNSSTISSSRLFGVSTTISGSIIISGIISDAQFTTIGGLPTPGGPVYLASSSDELNAAGKLTSTPPTNGIIAEIGICLDNSDYLGFKKSKILLQVKNPIML